LSSSGGTVEPPVAMHSSDDRSSPSRSAASSTAISMVGTPEKPLARSPAMVRATRSASKVTIG